MSEKTSQINLCCIHENQGLYSEIYKLNKDKAYIARTGSTSQGSGTSRFMVRVLDNGMLAKNALGPFIISLVLLKSSCKIIAEVRHQVWELKSRVIKNRTSWLYHSRYYISVVILERKINKGALAGNKEINVSPLNSRQNFTQLFLQVQEETTHR